MNQILCGGMQGQFGTAASLFLNLQTGNSSLQPPVTRPCCGGMPPNAAWNLWNKTAFCLA
jgi:hypothetical protein